MTERVLHTFYVMLKEPKPPSSNHLYVRGMHGRMVLSKEGQAFKSALTAAVIAECSTLDWKRAVEDVYLRRASVRLYVGVHSTEFLNPAWKPGKKTKSGDWQSPYKKADGPNYSKAIEDGIADGTGIDDSAHFDSRIVKIPDSTSMVEVFYEIISQEDA